MVCAAFIFVCGLYSARVRGFNWPPSGGYRPLFSDGGVGFIEKTDPSFYFPPRVVTFVCFCFGAISRGDFDATKPKKITHFVLIMS